MRTIALAAGLVVASASFGLESPSSPTPHVELEREIHASSRGFIIVTARSNGPVVQWIVLDPGLTLIPPQLLRDSKTAVLMAERAGRFRLLAYTALGDVPSAPAIATIVVDAAPPPQNPVNPPANESTIWAVVIQPDGPLSPALAVHRKHPAWVRLKDRGVHLSWIEMAAVDPTYAQDIQGLVPPILLVLRVRTLNGKAVSNVVSRQSLPAPEIAERLVLEALP